jgi:hypothetical protein
VICQACRHWRRIGRLLRKDWITPFVVDVHDPEAADSARGISRQPIGDVGALLDMLLQHALVIHLVDVVPASSTMNLARATR